MLSFWLPAALLFGTGVIAPASSAIVAAILGLMIAAFHSGLQLSQLRRFLPARDICRQVNRQRTISVHIPTHDEPPELVAETLHALSQVDHDRFEVIVLDNNTSDIRKWLPVQKLCIELGDRFRFYHRENVIGAKAGALNICLELTDPSTDYIVVIDADYVVDPQFLAEVTAHLEDETADFVQFPQAYRQVKRAQQGIALELNAYFDISADAADRQDAMLLTGTLSAIRQDALRQVGGWSGETITEDAELGLRLRAAGYQGRYSPLTLGRGLLPVDLAGLRIQRHRWIVGNLQALLQFWKSGNARRVPIIAQLSAWWSPSLMPTVLLILVGLSAGILNALDDSAELAANIAASTLALVVATRVILLAYAGRRQGASGADFLGALAVKLALVTTGALAPFALIKRQKPMFRRTVKDLRSQRRTGASNQSILLGILGAMSSIGFVVTGAYFPATACIFLVLPGFAELWLDATLCAPTSTPVRAKETVRGAFREHRHTDV